MNLLVPMEQEGGFDWVITSFDKNQKITKGPTVSWRKPTFGDQKYPKGGDRDTAERTPVMSFFAEALWQIPFVRRLLGLRTRPWLHQNEIQTRGICRSGKMGWHFWILPNPDVLWGSHFPVLGRKILTFPLFGPNLVAIPCVESNILSQDGRKSKFPHPLGQN